MTERFEVILADPPWQYRDARPWQRIENHYPTLTLDELCLLPVSQWRQKDCVLFLWATSPKLAEAFRVLEAWGFEYKTSLVWKKEGAIGMGYYARIDHELLLVGTSGNPGVPSVDARVSSVVSAPKRRHSEKPPVFHAIIERMYPQARRLELFARAARPGWYAWGNEAEGAFRHPSQPELRLDLPTGIVLPLEWLDGDADATKP